MGIVSYEHLIIRAIAAVTNNIKLKFNIIHDIFG